MTAARRANVEDERACGWLLAYAPRRQIHVDTAELKRAWGEGCFWVLPAQQHVWVEALSAFLVVDVERAPASLSLPSRSFFRAFAMEGADAPEVVLQQLHDAFFQHALLEPGAHCLIAFSTERWFDRALESVGLVWSEKVLYLELDQLFRYHWERVQLAAGCTVQPASPGDRAALVQLDEEVFGPIWRWSSAQLSEAAGLLWLARCGGEIVGYFSLGWFGDTAFLARLAVKPSWQGQGIGRALLVQGVQLAQQAGMRRMLLGTQASNLRALQLYRRTGFRETGQCSNMFVRHFWNETAPVVARTPATPPATSA